jgi:hypothetical protein
MRRVAFAATLTLLVGCTAHYQVNTISAPSEKLKLDPTRCVYVTVPEDGQYESKPAGGSGQIVAQAVANAFGKKAKKIHIEDKHESREAYLSEAQQVQAAYVVVPTISSWEQRATEWSGRPSRMMIRIAIVDAKNGEQLAVTSIEGRSRIMSVTSTSPESLLHDPLEEYVGSLY